MKIIVGLGNPGPQYQNTRHNLGFLAVRHWAQTQTTSATGAFWRADSRLQCLRAQLLQSAEKIYLALPLTFMNESGTAVAKLLRACHATPADLLVVHDDLDLPWGKLRFKDGGSDGGHNGLKSIIQHLQTSDFARLKIGLAPDTPSRLPAEKFVLRPFSRADLKNLEQEILPATSSALDDYLQSGLPAAMNRHN